MSRPAMSVACTYSATGPSPASAVVRPMSSSTSKDIAKRGRRMSPSTSRTLLPESAIAMAVLMEIVLLPSDGSADVNISVLKRRAVRMKSRLVRSARKASAVRERGRSWM